MTQPGCFKALCALVSRIKQSANAAGIHTIRDMAFASGVSKSGIAKIYNRKSFPTFDTLLAMANACGTTVHEWTRDLEQDADSKGKPPERTKPQDSDSQQGQQEGDSQPEPADGGHGEGDSGLDASDGAQGATGDDSELQPEDFEGESGKHVSDMSDEEYGEFSDGEYVTETAEDTSDKKVDLMSILKGLKPLE